MVEALMDEVGAQADERNLEVLERLLREMLIPTCNCKRCRLMYEYVLLKINAHRIHKHLRNLWDTPEVFSMTLIHSSVIGEAKEKRAEARAALCVCGGRLWKNLSYPFTWRKQASRPTQKIEEDIEETEKLNGPSRYDPFS